MLSSLKALAEEILFVLLIPVYIVLAPAFILMTLLGLALIAAGVGTMVLHGDPNWEYIGGGFAVLMATFSTLAVIDQLYRWISHS